MHARGLALFLTGLALGSVASRAGAQTFTRITSGNPVVTTPVPASAMYSGCAWGDFDGDGDPDLYVVQEGLFRNDGGGNFTRLSTIPVDHALATGCSWADVDNDGDLDLFVSGGPPGGSVMYRNDGGLVFTRMTSGIAGDARGNQGWGCAWADYDLDGRIDLVVAAAAAFNNITTKNHLLHNLGAFTFERVDTSAVCAQFAPFTTPSWNDIDDDGDPDLFIASGPANGTRAPDFLYENRRTAPGQTFFRRYTTGAMATDLHDAQLYNWIDFDSDGDLDCYVTNYGGSVNGSVNDLYRNDGGVFTKLTGAEAGPIASDIQHSLASVWGDFDNDGDLDCVVTNDGSEVSHDYVNDGHGFFTEQTSVDFHSSGPRWGAAAADYDGDGDVDLYLQGPTGIRALYRNDLDLDSAHGWLAVRCVGTISNRAAIGTRVWVRSTIGGVSHVLVQQVSAQNSFGGHNDFVLHFGLGDAAAAESVIVLFPSGVRQVMTDVPSRQQLTVIEDAATAVTVSLSSAEATSDLARLVWQLGDARGRVGIDRRDEASPWQAVGDVVPDGTGRVVFEDPGVVAGRRYAWSLRVTEDGGEQRLGETWLTIPPRDGLAIAWSGDRNANRLRFAVTLPHAGGARLTLVDTSGRVVARQDLALPTGRSDVDLGSRAHVAPGIYWARVAQDDHTRSARIAVLR